ncbi:Dabb family protein [Flammeovirga pacifica]|uniref:Stress protein n=1 Tax=Flammeovirga pacifica TaxID=915059 RepID=A0A1S1YU37_FLAPC|nr:Dabb family protein [Flammeovirga pacifica]OHX64315.1 stress protein [Flammeovirga pacifica]
MTLTNKFTLLLLLLLTGQTSFTFSQQKENLVINRQDIKDISAKNTVTVTHYEKDGKNYVYVGGFGNIDVFSLSENGQLTPVSNHELYKQKGPARGMVATNVLGNDFLFVANKYGNVIETFQIQKNGSIERVALTEDTEDTYLGVAITLQVVKMKNKSYLFIGGLEETPGLSCFAINKDGSLSHVQSMKDDEKIHTDGIIGMSTHKINGKTYLYTGGFQDNGISSFRVYDNGSFKNINNISDNKTDRYLTGTYPVCSVQLGEDHFVVVGHRHHKYYKRKGFIKNTDFTYHGDALTVFKIDNKGRLHQHSVLKDSDYTRLKGQTRIELVSQTDNEAVLAIGTRDDSSIQLCTLNKEGTLQPIHYLETGFSIYYGLDALQINNVPFLVAGSFRFDLGKVISYKVEKGSDHKNKNLKHVVSLKYKASATKEEIDNALKTFEDLKDKIPEITALEWGENDSMEGHSKGFTYCFTLTFNNASAREKYLFHPAHLDLVKTIGPIIEDVFVMDYWTEKQNKL